MLVLLLCCMMKILEFSSSPPTTTSTATTRKKRRRRYRRPPGQRGRGKVMNEAECGGGIGGGGGGKGDLNSNVSVIERSSTASCLSNASSQDVDFVQDNSDYQWFLDYGYRDGGLGIHQVQHAGVLSSLAESYDCTTSDGCYYETLSKNLDANLAEADMESFRTEDIHALLTTLPAMCAAVPAPGARDAFASVTGSMLAKFDILASSMASSSTGSLLLRGDHSSGGGDDSSSRADASPDTMSICKSELLFSPVKETPMPGTSFSVDSLDCDLDHDLMITCQANKENYTIAFEGSVVTTCSADGSDSAADVSAMARSDSGLTTWSELKGAPLKRHPSGNNNSAVAPIDEDNTNEETQTAKSHSMPDLHQQNATNCVKLFDIQHQTTNTNAGSYYSDMAVSVDAASENTSGTNNPHRFSLVKLFMRQRSASAEGVGSLDRSSASEGCWPTSGIPGGSHGGSQSEDSGCGEDVRHVLRRSHAFIREEQDDAEVDHTSERSESVEQLSEESAVASRPEYSIYTSNNNGSTTRNACIKNVVNRSMQTSAFNSFRPTPPVRVVPPSFLATLRQQQQQQPVYVVYPNYTLPDLGFLNEKRTPDVHIIPQNVPKRRSNVTTQTPRIRRPFSCNDVESLKRRGFSHVRDWDSLTFLLPAECRQVLADVPELAGVLGETDKPKETPQFCATPQTNINARRPRPASCDCGSLADRYTASSSSSTATQPSSGYRGSSTMLLTDSSQQNSGQQHGLNPLLVYRYDSVTSSQGASVFSGDRYRTPPIPRRSASLSGAERQPPRPPLPRGILRRAPDECKARKNLANTKRYSRPLSETEHEAEEEEEDEGVETGHTTDSSLDERFERAKARPPTPPLPRKHAPDSNSCDELEQLEEYLKSSAGLSSCSEGDDWDEADLPRLRSHVARFLALKINRSGGRKSVSFAPPPLVLDTAIREEESISPPAPAPSPTADVSHKMSLVSAVTRSVERLVQHFSTAMDRVQLEALGDSDKSPTCARLVLSMLCPAMYALFSDGLKPSLDTPFGPIGNSVWQVVEATAQQGGPLTGALGDLVARVNALDVSAEGLVKFNAFVCGLLNVRSLDAWAAFVRTRETTLRRHYAPSSLLLLAHTSAARSLLDALVAALRPLALLPFRLDLLYESRELHRSFRRIIDSRQLLHVATDDDDDEDESQATMIQRCSPGDSSSERSLPDLLNSAQQRTPITEERPRPRSCVDDNVPTTDVAATVRKRWSGVHMGSKFVQAFDRLADDTEEEYTDSLEPHRSRRPTQDLDTSSTSPVVSLNEETEPEESDPVSLDSQPINGGKFRRLQLKWEMLSGKDVNTGTARNDMQQTPPQSPGHTTQRSRIPRPVASPVKSAIPVPLSPSSSKPVGATRQPVAPNIGGKKPPVLKSAMPRKNNTPVTARTSRLDQVDGIEGRIHPVRPSSLPYRPVSGPHRATQLTPPRRAVSSSVTRKQQQQQQQTKQQNKTPKIVRTLSHRLPSDNGHLSYNEGDRLKVILEVDARWLLCCRGDRKGLVPRSAVIAVSEGGPRK